MRPTPALRKFRWSLSDGRSPYRRDDDGGQRAIRKQSVVLDFFYSVLEAGLC